MKTAAMIGVLGVVLGVGVFGVREAWSYVQGTAVQVRKEVKANIPIGVELSRVEKMLDNLSAVIARQRDQVVRATVDADVLARDVAKMSERLVQDKKVLKLAANFLARKEDYYEIGEQTYSHEEIESDATEKLALYQRNERLLAMRKQNLQAIRAAIGDSNRDIKSAKARRDELSALLQSLQVRHQRVTIQKELAPATTHPCLPGRGTGIVSQAEKAMTELELRLAKDERGLQSRLVSVTNPLRGIAYRDQPEKNAAEMIEDHFAIGGQIR